MARIEKDGLALKRIDLETTERSKNRVTHMASKQSFEETSAHGMSLVPTPGLRLAPWAPSLGT